ncbi:VOC family protein [Dactylosporangium aurantiacum]|uniref:VOC family protein n=1 Tax=Dactylosporangium aurantiacum TaxID=35754 RepID=A0A9Q9MDV2_9ACTN|nr:VOC family protein [Dactylosporangium aurantiacum]MDG6101669.1 VOC family protein [Dactylosporangium aurantiacum]UWZ52509.1 VOC family protein [Dactylosporangium aurantiacum]
MNRQELSDAVSDAGWRYVLGTLMTTVPVGSVAEAARVAARCAAAAGPDADGHLWLDLRADHVQVSLRTIGEGRPGERDVALARAVTDALREAGLATVPATGRAVQLLEIAVDALDIPAVRPFWKAVLGYADEPGVADDPGAAVADPHRLGPTVWFQQMTEPRTERNRIHLDISVPHDAAADRIAAALAAGGVLVSEAAAPAYWILADAEGNEVCVTTWQGRD